MAQSPTSWCPSCGAEYVAGASRCADCRVALVDRPPDGAPEAADADGAGEASDLVELGTWPRLSALILRRRLEGAGVPVMVEWSGSTAFGTGTVVVPEEHGDFAWSVIQEVEPEDEVPDRSPEAYVALVEERLAEVVALLDELRVSVEQQSATAEALDES